MRAQSRVSMGLLVAVLFVCAAVGGGGGAAAANLGDQCTSDFQKLAMCLNYATGKAAAPTKDCCSSVSEIKDKDPACLCFIIQQTFNGSEQIKSMGIQEARLLQLPSACKLTNASISDCPKLLNIPASSPDYKIFTNPPSTTPNTTTATSSTSPSTTTGTSSPITAGDSIGSKHGPLLAGLVLPIAMTIFFCAFFPVEIV